MKCSFCDAPLICKSCNRPFKPHHAAPHLAAYQPDMEVACPECHAVLVCKLCGYVFGEEEEEAE
jgi:DNA-directed RNA polymerase subunit RPC12/RpoP